MFLTGVLVGCVLGTTVCLAVALHLATEAEGARIADQQAMVPLHVSPATLVSLN